MVVMFVSLWSFVSKFFMLKIIISNTYVNISILRHTSSQELYPVNSEATAHTVSGGNDNLLVCTLYA